jgi:uncharacterized SAM-binding protein YcdF (DUF218 family)
MNSMLTNALAALLLPPLNLFLLGGAGWYLLNRRRPLLGKALIFAAIAALWLLSTPFVADKLIASLEADTLPPTGCRPQAIVVLGAGTYVNAPEYGGDTVPVLGLERLRLAAHLHRRTPLPILISGGHPDNGKFSEAALVKDVLENDFKVPAKWTEDASHNTRENAVFSQKILQQAGISSVYLVTQAWHMPRAQSIFSKTGLCVVPAGTGFKTRRHQVSLNIHDFLPSATALYDSYLFMHETIGLVWYRLRA